jgi:hypothetical protein
MDRSQGAWRSSFRALPISLRACSGYRCLSLQQRCVQVGTGSSSNVPVSMFNDPGSVGTGAIGPLASLAVAPGIDRQGSPVNPTSVFGADAPEVVAVAQVGGLSHSSAPLTFSWFQVKPDAARQSLFTRCDRDPWRPSLLAGAERWQVRSWPVPRHRVCRRRNHADTFHGVFTGCGAASPRKRCAHENHRGPI